MSVSDVVKFVMENRKNKICKGWTPYQITYDVSEAIKRGNFAYTVNDNGALTGVCWGTSNSVTKVFHVDAILTIEKSALKELVQYFQKTFKDWIILAERRNVFRSYNTPRLIQKIYRQHIIKTIGS
jgi:hypothetical protein